MIENQETRENMEFKEICTKYPQYLIPTDNIIVLDSRTIILSVGIKYSVRDLISIDTLI